MQWLSIEFSGKLQLLPVYGGGSICGVYGGSTATTTTAMMGTDATTTQSLDYHDAVAITITIFSERLLAE
ncbi:hypothetical protein TYRP_013694 [Tyrophagus putrescentiae]|nr:hypothetical protein TYRP_013694 [Tyrophagus putrescentiae]